MQDYVEISSLVKFVVLNKSINRIQISSTFLLGAQRKNTREKERVGRHFRSYKLFPSPSTTITRHESNAWLTWRACKGAGVADLIGCMVEDWRSDGAIKLFADPSFGRARAGAAGSWPEGSQNEWSAQWPSQNEYAAGHSTSALQKPRNTLEGWLAGTDCWGLLSPLRRQSGPVERNSRQFLRESNAPRCSERPSISLPFLPPDATSLASMRNKCDDIVAECAEKSIRISARCPSLPNESHSHSRNRSPVRSCSPKRMG